MIVVRIIGGLGNQMFQYALGRRLSIDTGQVLRLDANTPNPNPLGIFDLDRFAIGGLRVGRRESQYFWRPLVKAAEIAHRMSFRVGMLRVALEGSLEFHPEVLENRGTVYLAGNWQSERYFAEIAPVLRRDFQVVEPPSQADRALLGEMTSGDSVCVHVRRGDYVADPAVYASHGVCGEDYYAAARRRMAERLSAPRFYVFSDDQVWARTAMGSWPSTKIVDHHPAAARHADFRLMTACRHFIIANSSFSWWAAWLSDSVEKTVIAPRNWFANPAWQSAHIVPETWQRL